MKPAQIRVVRVVSVPFEENSYIVQRGGRSDCLVVDPGLEPDKIIRQLQGLGATPAAILNTHGHCDHVAGNAAIKELWPDCPVIIGVLDAPKLTDPALNLSEAFGLPITLPPAERTVNEGDVLDLAGIELRVLWVPGHSRGHVVYYCGDHEPPLAFVGDVIMAGCIGRTDFPDGDYEDLIQGIRGKVFALPPDTLLLSGHGPTTTVEQERRENPFVGMNAT